MLTLLTHSRTKIATAKAMRKLFQYILFVMHGELSVIKLAKTRSALHTLRNPESN